MLNRILVNYYNHWNGTTIKKKNKGRDNKKWRMDPQKCKLDMRKMLLDRNPITTGQQ